MRKLIVFLILIAVSFSACKKEDSKGLLDPATPIKISALETRAVDDSALFVIENSLHICWRNSIHEPVSTDFGVGERYLKEGGLTRDLQNRKFLFAGVFIVVTKPTTPPANELGMFMTNCKDVVFTIVRDSTGKVIYPKELEWELFPKKTTEDTVAYIPNAILSKAQAEIRAAYAAEDFTTCYKLFDDAFVFIPTTGAKWRAMKAAGIE